MSVSIACYCDGLPAHGHAYKHEALRDAAGNVVGLSSKADPFEVNIWVDWKAVARELSQDGAS